MMLVHPSTQLCVARGCAIILLALFIIPFAAAEVQTLGTFRSGDDINLVQISNATYCNITSLLYPNSSFALQNVEMTRDGVNFNYTITGFSWPTGEYIVNGECDTTVWAYNFYVTPSGISQASVLDNPIQILLFALSLFLLFTAIYLENPFIGFISSIVIILTGIYFMIYGFNNYTDLYTQGAAIITIGLGFVIMFISAYEFSWGSRED